jgi:hypothetical protein
MTAGNLDLIEFAPAIIRIVNTCFEKGGGPGHLQGAEHGGSAFDGVGLAANGYGIGLAHAPETLEGVVDEDGEDLFESFGANGMAQALENGAVDDGVAAGIGRGLGRGDRRLPAAGEDGAELIRRKRLGKDGIVAVEVIRGGGAHGEKHGAGSSEAQGAGELSAGQAGHAEVGKDAIEEMGFDELQGLLAALRLKHKTALRFEQDGSDGQADGVVIDGENAVGSDRGPGFHVGLILHIGM